MTDYPTAQSAVDAIVVKLQSLALRNFRGAIESSLKPDGHDLDIYGRNGRGKTTFADAYYWLLFGKDSLGKKEFRLKTEDENGEPIHHLEHGVFAEFKLADGETITLEKILKEEWVKSRGNEDREFEGHTTTYKINGVPSQAGEYERWISGICDEKRFRLLTDPSFFIDQMTWQERRSLLIDVCGDISDTDVIESDSKLTSLPAILEKRTLEDHRKIITARRIEVAKAIDDIPGRLNELDRMLPKDQSAWQDPREEFRKKLAAFATEKATIRSGGQIAEFKKKLAVLEGAEIDLMNKARRDTNVAAIEADQAADEIQKEIGQIETTEATLTFKLNADREALDGMKDRLAKHAESWRQIKAQTFTWTGEESCMTCGRPLDPELIESAKAKALEEFNLAQAAKLEENLAAGKQMTATKKMLEEKIEAREKELAALPSIPELIAKRDSHRATAEELRQQAPSATSNDLAANRAEQEKVKGDMRILEADASELIKAIEEKEAAVSAEIAKADEVAAGFAAAERTKARIEELRAEQKKLSAELSKIDKEISLCEAFVRRKVRMLDEKINRRFKIARFRLFEIQINKGLKEKCDVTYLGRPPSNGEKLKVGLDIINTLAEHYGFAPPIFIDNAEALDEVPATLGQQIRLRVSAADETLRVVAAKDRIAMTA